MKHIDKVIWIRRPHPGWIDEYICSVCGASFAGLHNTCPKCGSFMRKFARDPEWVYEVDYRGEIPGKKKPERDRQSLR